MIVYLVTNDWHSHIGIIIDYQIDYFIILMILYYYLYRMFYEDLTKCLLIFFIQHLWIFFTIKIDLCTTVKYFLIVFNYKCIKYKNKKVIF